MEKLRELLRNASIARVFLFTVLWGFGTFVYFHAHFDFIGAPEFGNIDDPPAVTQLVYPPYSLPAVVEPPATAPGTIRIAWISASPVLFGLGDPKVVGGPAGFIQDPISRELSARLGRPVSVEAYAMAQGRILEKFLASYHALQTKPDVFVLSLDYWDFSNQSIAVPRFTNFHEGLIARHPLALFQSVALWRFLHASEIAWAAATDLLPALRYRLEMQMALKSWYSRFDPIVHKASVGPSAEMTELQGQALFYFVDIRADPSDPRKRLVGNETILDGLLDMIRRSGIPAFVYVDPTQALGSVETLGLEGALARYQSDLPAGTMVIEPRNLDRFIGGIEFLNTNHLRKPAPAMTKYLADQVEALYRHAHTEREGLE